MIAPGKKYNIFTYLGLFIEIYGIYSKNYFILTLDPIILFLVSYFMLQFTRVYD